MNKRGLIFIIICLFFSCILLPSVNAEANAYVSADILRVREQPTTESSVLIKIYNGEAVTVTDTNKISGTGCNDGWYKIDYNGKIGYVCSTYIRLGNINSSYNVADYTARVYANSVSVRSYASSSASKITTLLNGTNLTILETLNSGNGCNDPWFKVNYHNNKIGYICSSYILKKEDITDTDAEYEATLREAGFPDSYIPYLVHLHKKNPNWIFRPIITNLKWDNVISGESGKNYIQNPTEEVYRTSSTPAEGKTWFEATDGVNAFFIDPRNFLTERFIFMFENLQFDEQTQTPEIVKSVFGSSYLAADEYVGYFINAGRDFNVSPVHLAARVVQEGGANSNYPAITGTSTQTYRGHSLKGFYNYYNIGAYEDAYTNSSVTRGLAYAAGLVGGDGLCVGTGRCPVLIEIGGIVERAIGIQNNVDGKVIAVRGRGKTPGTDERIDRLGTFCRGGFHGRGCRSGLSRDGIIRTGGQHGDHHQDCKNERDCSDRFLHGHSNLRILFCRSCER